MEQSEITAFRTKLLQAKKVGLDSMVFLYHFADHPQYASYTEIVFQLMEEGKLSAVTSTITVSELFVRAEEKNDQMTILAYEQFLKTLPHLEILPVDWYLARLAAKLRANYPLLRLPDALQLSAPLLRGYPVFITNDKKMKKVKEIEVITFDKQ